MYNDETQTHICQVAGLPWGEDLLKGEILYTPNLYISSSFRLINNSKNVDTAIVYLLPTIVIVCDNCRSRRLWLF